MKRLILLTFLLISLTGVAQEEKSNIQSFTPSILFQKGQYEIQSFYNLYTQSGVRDRQGERVELGLRQTFLNAMYQFTFGASRSGRVNLGIDVNISRAVYSSENSSPFRVLLPSKQGNVDRTVFASIGPRIKVNPAQGLPRFSIQSTFLVPVTKNLETPFTAHNRYTWNTQFFYDLPLNNGFQLFFEADFLYRISRNGDMANFFRTPISAFINYFPSSKISFYGFAQHSPRFEKQTNGFDTQFGKSMHFTQLGIGAKYQITRTLGIEFSYGNFVSSRLDGAGQVFNFALRKIKR